MILGLIYLHRNETLTAVSVSVCRLPQLDPVATDVPTRKRSSVVMGRPPIIDLNPKLSTQRLVGHRNQYNNHHVSEQVRSSIQTYFEYN